MNTNPNATTEELLDNLRYLIENQKQVNSLCQQLIGAIDEVADFHESTGLKGMAHRHARLSKEAPDEYDRLRDEYTEAGHASAKSLMQVYSMVEGIRDGYVECLKAKDEMAN